MLNPQNASWEDDPNPFQTVGFMSFRVYHLSFSPWRNHGQLPNITSWQNAIVTYQVRPKRSLSMEFLGPP